MPSSTSITGHCRCKFVSTVLFFSGKPGKRRCQTCPHCGEHLTISKIGQIDRFEKEQQCPCYEIKAWSNAESCCAKTLANEDLWYETKGILWNVCEKCYRVYYIDPKISVASVCIGLLMSPKPITSKNYVGHYITWCKMHRFNPLRWDILAEIFFGCESDDDYTQTLNALALIQEEGFSLSFMDEKQMNALNGLIVKLKIRLELFKRIPSGNNMLLAYALIEEISLKKFSELTSELDDKAIDKFDKCKALAVSTKFIAERQLAFNRSVELFKKFAKVEI